MEGEREDGLVRLIRANLRLTSKKVKAMLDASNTALVIQGGWERATKGVVLGSPSLASLTLEMLSCDLGTLSHCTNLRSLHISRTAVSSLAPLASCTQLEILNLCSCGLVTSLAPLAHCSNLKSLNASYTGITSLDPLASCTQLETLFVESCHQITSLAPLAGLISLKVLNSRDTRVSDLTPLADLFCLETLDLRDCHNITDVGPLVDLALSTFLYREGGSVPTGGEGAAAVEGGGAARG